MNSINVIRALLIGAAPVLAMVPAREIVLGTVKQGSPLPAISIKHISTVPIAAFDAQAEFALVVSRVQVTAMTKDLATMSQVVEAVRKACNYQRGMIAGVDVVSVVRDLVGPDPDENDAAIFDQTIDFKITYHEPN